MRIAYYLCAAALMLVQFSGASAQTRVPQIRQADLSRTPIAAGQLRITIIDFSGSPLLAHAGHMKLLVENTSGSFVTFSPMRLAFVNQDGSQVDIFTVPMSQGGKILGYVAVVDRDLAPNAHVRTRNEYELSDKVELPAKLFYDRQLIAEITK